MTQGVNFVLSSMEMMRGGEIYVPKIPSTTIPQLATLVSPDLKQHVIGIRPGEKLHETMIPADDAHCTVELEDRYVILQGFANAPATPICIAAPGRWRKASAIPATPIRKSWTRAACRPCCRWPMPDRDISGEDNAPAFLPYGRQEIADADIKAVVEALVSGWLTTGPRVAEFEQAFAAPCRRARKASRSIPAPRRCIAPCAPLGVGHRRRSDRAGHHLRRLRQCRAL